MSIPEGPTFLLVPHSDTAIPGTIVRRRPDGSILPAPPVPAPFPMPIAQSGGGFGVLQHGLGYPGTANPTGQGTTNNDFGSPVLLNAGMRITGIGAIVTTAAVGNIRTALYASRPGDLYPTDLLAESALIDGNVAGVTLTPINITIAESGIFWGVYNSTTMAIKVAGLQSGMGVPILGWSATGTINQYTFYRARALAAFPDPFPAGALVGGGNTPMAVFRIEA